MSKDPTKPPTSTPSPHPDSSEETNRSPSSRPTLLTDAEADALLQEFLEAEDWMEAQDREDRPGEGRWETSIRVLIIHSPFSIIG
jgi:hypothetical protein